MKELISSYKKRKSSIKKRLREFSQIHKKDDADIFEELCFCILTPQAKAVVCDRAIKNLKAKGLLLKGTPGEKRNYLKGVRFPNNKAEYLVEARKIFKNGKSLDIKSKLDIRNTFKTREWLVKNIKGMGYKEASHFLRNIGLGKDLAILDRHILKNLKHYGVIEEIPVSISRRVYIDIENKMKDFFGKLKIPIEDIDLLFWSNETGMIFK